MLPGLAVLTAVALAAPAGAEPVITEPVELEKAAAGLTAGTDGYLWATQAEAPGKLLRIKDKGKPKDYLAGKISGFTKDREPGAITTSADGSLWFVEADGYVARFSAGGVVSEFGPLAGRPTAITLGPDGNIWVAEADAEIAKQKQGALARVTPAGAISEFGLGDVKPSYLTTGPDRALWFTGDENVVGRATTTGSVQLFDPGFDAHGIAAGMGDGLWLAGHDNLATISTAGSFMLGGAVDDALAIAAGPDGAIWFTAKDAIGRVTPDGAVTTYSDGLTPGNAGSAITTGPDGAMWFTHEKPLLGRITTPPFVERASVIGVGAREATVRASVRANALDAQATVTVRDSSGQLLTEKQAALKPGLPAVELSFAITGLTPETDYTATVGAASDAGPSITTSTAAFETAPEPTATPSPGQGLSPVLQQTVVVKASKGSVRVRTKGKWTQLNMTKSIPVGALIDTSRGTVRLETALTGGSTQTGAFHGGRFRVRQTGNGTAKLVLAGKLTCGTSGKLATVSGKRKRRRSLWGSDSGGQFQTQGRDSVATVRGTRWLTVDTCGGTLTRVAEGAVSVKPKGRGKAVLVKAGESRFVKHR